MATGGFAGGLAQGLRNGVSLYNAYEEGQERKDSRAKSKRLEEENKRIDEAIAQAAQTGGQYQDAGLQPITTQGAAAAQTGGLGLDPVAQTQPVAGQQPVQAVPLGGQATTSAGGLTPVSPQGQSAGLPAVDQAGQAPAAGLAPARAPTPAPNAAHSPGLQPAQGSSGQPPGNQQNADIGRALSGISAGVEAAWRENRPDRALQLMVQREKLSQAGRDQAYSQAMNQFTLTQDPNVFVPLVNDWLTTGVKLDAITPAAQTKDGMPIYMVEGTDLQSGKKFSQPFSQAKLQSYIQGVADPQVQRAMAAQQMERAYKAQQTLFEHDLAIDKEKAKPVKVGENERLVDGKGNVIAEGAALDANNFSGMSSRDQKRLVDSNKALSDQIFKLNGLDSNSLSGIGEDEKATVLQQIALAQLINTNNPGVGSESSGAISQIAYELSTGTKNILASRGQDGQIIYFARGMNGNVVIPSTAVPSQIRSRYEGNQPVER
ncbi:hypothetical protein RE432_14755 [Pusillimonas sp. SM2304]|uniref:hypothetical protein n=1 Tax=Pusillimonas sp. SM2304 TaxID=3073241 RepID=UPI0028757B7E|nr:hypothetical protein [Pusillimonas sp. SM2304]MDS1141699.1 hypothetical protein [Pusillimonas sp. SM2304]